ncbi:MAG: type 4a pilus biogenesis protein PilO [Armatimonadota bacterium]
MKLNLTPKSFYALTGVVAAAGAGLMWMANSSISSQTSHIETLKKELRDEKTVLKELEDSKKKVEDLKFKLVHLEAGVQDFAYIPTMLKELEQFGKKNNLEITQVKPLIAPVTPGKEEDKRKSAYQELNINVKGRGTYENSLKFLEAIKVFPKIVAVRTVSLSPHLDNTSKKYGKPVLELDLELRAYAFKDEKKESKDTKTAAAPKEGGKHES